MAVWGNFKIAIFVSISKGSEGFLYVFSDHVLQARGRGSNGTPAALPRGQTGPPNPRLPTQQG